VHQAASLLHEEIKARGPISFARFMEVALYHPAAGYYARREPQTGRRGDFFTSVSVGSLFGELLGCQFAEWLEPLQQNLPGRRLMLVEAGAHDGQLAHDILAWFQTHRPELWTNVDYRIVEPQEALRSRQQSTLEPFAEQVIWCRTLQDLPPVHGVILSNELLDAFPIHRLGWDAVTRDWFEWGVKSEGERFAWERMGPWRGSRELLPALATPEGEALADLLPEGFTIELNPGACDWWGKAAHALQQGRLITLDYGLESEDRLAPHRGGGTLRAYREHRIADDPLADPGSQDLTAHVDFTALERAGEAAGLAHTHQTSQSRFLTAIVQRARYKHPTWLVWDDRQVRQFVTLTHPGHLGQAFRVLVQESRAKPALDF
jgi:SAM-dependent MidA family methyltransferase